MKAGRRPWLSLAGGALALVLALAAALLHGSLPLEPWHVLQVCLNPALDPMAAQVLALRWERALNALAVGGLLALAGALIQVLLQNPLGDPYTLGVSGGATAAILAGLVFGLPGGWSPLLGGLGALFSMLLVFVAQWRAAGWFSDRLLLTGIVLAAGWSALISLLIALSSGEHLPGILYWLMGDLSGAGAPGGPLLTLGLGLLLALALARSLDILAQGELRARTLGVDSRRLGLGLFLLTSVLTATAVSQAGNIGFVGLIVPHLFRLLGGSAHRHLLPGAVLFGATLLVAADTLSRTLIAPQQLPVGILTALLGVPLFLVLLQSRDA